jgi:hypothetical protein
VTNEENTFYRWKKQCAGRGLSELELGSLRHENSTLKQVVADLTLDRRVNAKRIYRLYGDEGLTVRTKPRQKLASRARVPLPAPTRPNERWSMDLVSARTADGRWFRMLTVLDIYTRESLALVADRSLTGVKVVRGWRIYAATSDAPAPQLALCH